NQREQLQPVHRRQAQIGDHHVGPIDQFQRLLGRSGFVDVEARRDQVQLDHAAQLFFVIDNQNAFFHLRIGRYTRKTLPFFGSLSTAILPPCSSTIFETIPRPRQTPPCLAVR